MYGILIRTIQVKCRPQNIIFDLHRTWLKWAYSIISFVNNCASHQIYYPHIILTHSIITIAQQKSYLWTYNSSYLAFKRLSQKLYEDVNLKMDMTCLACFLLELYVSITFSISNAIFFHSFHCENIIIFQYHFLCKENHYVTL